MGVFICIIINYIVMYIGVDLRTECFLHGQLRGIFSNWGPESSYDFNFNRKYNKKHHILRSLIKFLF